MTVTEIATNLGFVELGRFSVEYRKVFGERPSETLVRQRALHSPPPKLHGAEPYFYATLTTWRALVAVHQAVARDCYDSDTNSHKVAAPNFNASLQFMMGTL